MHGGRGGDHRRQLSADLRTRVSSVLGHRDTSRNLYQYVVGYLVFAGLGKLILRHVDHEMPA